MPDMRPALPVYTDEDTRGKVRVDLRTGERYREYEQGYTEYDVGRIRAGYCCIHCGEAQEQSFPEKCWVCHFPMKDEQSAEFAKQFEGYTTIGPSRSLEELRAEDEEMKERARRQKVKPTSSIAVPSWAKL